MGEGLGCGNRCHMEANTAIAERQWLEEMGKQIRELPVLYSYPELEQCVLSSVSLLRGHSVWFIAGTGSATGRSLRWIPEASGKDPTQGSFSREQPRIPRRVIEPLGGAPADQGKMSVWRCVSRPWVGHLQARERCPSGDMCLVPAFILLCPRPGLFALAAQALSQPGEEEQSSLSTV